MPSTRQTGFAAFLLGIWLWLFIPVMLTAQAAPVFKMPEGIGPEDYLPGTLIAKLLTEHAGIEKAGNRNSILLTQALEEIGSATRKFPQHQTPITKRHASGQPIPDLSLILEIKTQPGQALEQAINQLYQSGLFEYVQPYYLPHTLYQPNDPFTGSQYYLTNIRAYQAWDISRGDTTVVIAISDTGTDLAHPDLIKALAYNYNDPIDGKDNDNDGYIDNFRGWDFGENNNNPQYNANAHGVHVSGIAAASADNGTGIAGTGFHSRYLPIKISDADGRLVRSYESIVYAADMGAKVINCSWGSPFGAGQFGQDIINYAVLFRDAVVVAAAGNANSQVPYYPASYANVLNVAATDIQDVKWANSSFGPQVSLSAPGANILSTWVNGTYLSSSGTSMAAPMVAGAAAILRSHYPQYSAKQIMALLQVSTDPIDQLPGNEAFAGRLGSGRLNMYRALTENHRPFVQVESLEHPLEYYEKINPGENIQVIINFLNILAPASGIKAHLSSSSDFVDILNPEIELPFMPHGQITNNALNPFVATLKPGIPSSHQVTFILNFYTAEGEFAGRETTTMVFNKDYLNVANKWIGTTINSRGGIGYNYPNYNQGKGFTYALSNQEQSMIKMAGIMAGVSTSQVVDHIYGASEGSFNNAFSSLQNARRIENSPRAPIHIKGSFDDSQAGSARLKIKVDYDILMFEDPPHEKTVILEYLLINQSGAALPGLYAGFFADWVIQDFRNHRAAFDETLNLGYAYSAAGGHYTGISLISHPQAKHYAFDNQGFGGSIKISDGFTGFEKYTAMKGNRPAAGLFDKDNDISTLLSTGPFNLANQDTLKLVFALMAGDHLNDLQSSAQQAYARYNAPLSSNPDIRTKDFKIKAFPNPLSQELRLQFNLPATTPMSLQVIGMQGNIIFQQPETTYHTGSHLLKLDSSHWPAGVYILQLKTPDNVQTLKILKSQP